MVSAFDAVLIRSLAYAAADRLVMISDDMSGEGRSEHSPTPRMEPALGAGGRQFKSARPDQPLTSFKDRNSGLRADAALPLTSGTRKSLMELDPVDQQCCLQSLFDSVYHRWNSPAVWRYAGLDDTVPSFNVSRRLNLRGSVE